MEEDAVVSVEEQQVYESPTNYFFDQNYEVADAGDGLSHVKPSAQLSEGRQDYDILDQNGNRLFYFFVEDIVSLRPARGQTELLPHEEILDRYILSMHHGYTYCAKAARRLARRYRLPVNEVDDALRVGALAIQLHTENDGPEEEKLEKGIEVQRIKTFEGEVLVTFIGNPTPYKYVAK